MIADESQREDFETVISDPGLDVSDFELSGTQNPLSSLGPEPITGEIIVRRLSTGVLSSYAGGHLSRWLEQFDADLGREAFNRT